MEGKWKSKPLCGEEIFQIKKMLWYIAVTLKILDFNMTRYVDGPHRNFLITTKIYPKGIEFFVAMFCIPEFYFSLIQNFYLYYCLCLAGLQCGDSILKPSL